MSVVGKKFRPLSENLSYLFWSLVGNFSVLVLSVVTKTFSPFVASRLTPLTPSDESNSRKQSNKGTYKLYER